MIKQKIDNAKYIMNQMIYHRKLRRVGKQCVDEKSQMILEAVYRLKRYGDKREFVRSISDINDEQYTVNEIETKWGKNIVLIKQDRDVEYCEELLKCSKWKDNVKVIDIDDIKSVNDSEFIYVNDENLGKNIIEKCKDVDVMVAKQGILFGEIGYQYFDVLRPGKDEVFIDAGAYNGENDLQFARWTNGDYEKIYAFELDPRNAEKSRAYYKNNNVNNVFFISKGTGNSNETIRLDDGRNATAGSCVGEGKIEGYITRIDDEVDKATYIKMDIEGAELDSLKGAAHLIKKDKPKLAICIYHKPQDPYELYDYIKSLVPEYKVKIRHYTSWYWETVMYATVNEDDFI